MADARDIATAGEYVLGTLPLQERRAFETRLRADAALAAEVDQWQAHFAPLVDEIEAAEPPAAVWAALETRLFATTRPAGVAPVWRWLGIGGTVAAAALAAVVWMGQPVPTNDGLWVSDMVSEDGTIRMAALYDDVSGEMRVSVGGLPPARGRDWELWLIQGDKAPISLGLMPHQGKAQMQIPADLRNLLADATLAITDEPAGGSGGVATGPVVAAAQLRRI